MGIQSIDHFEIVANDVQRTLDFYRNLGFEVDEKASRGEGRTRSVLKIGSGQQINVVSPEWVKSLGRSGSTGETHFCLVWNGSVEEVQDQLSKSGITPRRGPGPVAGARGPATSIYFVDPDDNSVEIMVYP